MFNENERNWQRWHEIATARSLEVTDNMPIDRISVDEFDMEKTSSTTSRLIMKTERQNESRDRFVS